MAATCASRGIPHFSSAPQSNTIVRVIDWLCPSAAARSERYRRHACHRRRLRSVSEPDERHLSGRQDSHHQPSRRTTRRREPQRCVDVGGERPRLTGLTCCACSGGEGGVRAAERTVYRVRGGLGLSNCGDARWQRAVLRRNFCRRIRSARLTSNPSGNLIASP
jgi:hypothetical protein